MGSLGDPSSFISIPMPTRTVQFYVGLTLKRAVSQLYKFCELQIPFPSFTVLTVCVVVFGGHKQSTIVAAVFYRPTLMTFAWPGNFILSPCILTLSVQLLPLICPVIPFRADQWGPTAQLVVPHT